MTAKGGGNLVHRRALGSAWYRRLPTPSRTPWRTGAVWVLLAGATVLVSVGLGASGLPSPTLFGALIVGLSWAVSSTHRTASTPPSPVMTAAHAVLGVSIGTLVQPSTLDALATTWLPVCAVVVSTIALSIGAGLLLGRHPAAGRPTGVFAMVAGGAAGVTAIAGRMGADDRQVAVVQYVRVLVIVMFMPVAAHVMFDVGPAGRATLASAGSSALGLAFTAACAAAGLACGRVIRLPAAELLGPMVVAAAVTVSPLAPGATVPTVVFEASFALIGLDVGLRFTRQSLRAVRQILPTALALILLVITFSAAMGWLLSQATGVSGLDGYLATTPGGLYAVVGTAVDTGGDATFVLAVQVLRLVLIMLAAPLLARALRPAHAVSTS